MPCRLTSRGLFLTTFDKGSGGWITEPVTMPIRYLFVHVDVEPGTTFRDLLTLIVSDDILTRTINESFWCDCEEMLRAPAGTPPQVEVWHENPTPLLSDDGRVIGIHPPANRGYACSNAVQIQRQFTQHDTVTFLHHFVHGTIAGDKLAMTTNGPVDLSDVLDLRIDLTSRTIPDSDTLDLGTAEDFEEEWTASKEKVDETVDEHQAFTLFEVISALFTYFGDCPLGWLNQTQADRELQAELESSPFTCFHTYKKEGLDGARSWFLKYDDDMRRNIVADIEQSLERAGTAPIVGLFFEGPEDLKRLLTHLKEWMGD